MEEGATVTVYAAAGACDQAQRVLKSGGEPINSLHVSVVCLPPVRRGNNLDLARIGANARRATQDSSAIAYIGEAGPAATRFSETILEEAGIAQLSEISGSEAMHKVLAALNRVDIDSGNLRESVNDELQ